MFSKNIVFVIQYIKDNYPNVFLILSGLKETKDFDIDDIEESFIDIRQWVSESYKTFKFMMLNNQTDYYSYFLIDNKYCFSIDIDEGIQDHKTVIYIDYKIIINNLDNFDLSYDKWLDDEIMLLKLLGV